MAAVEGAVPAPELAIIQTEVQHQTAQEIKIDAAAVDQSAQEVKQALDLRAQRKEPVLELSGDKADPDSAKSKANGVKRAVVKVLLASRVGKILLPDTAVLTAQTQGIVQSLISKLDAVFTRDNISVNEVNASYIHRLITAAVHGQISDQESLVRQFKDLYFFQAHSPGSYQSIRKAMLEVSEERGWSRPSVEQAIAQVEEEMAKATDLAGGRRLELPSEDDRRNFSALGKEFRDALKANVDAAASASSLTPSQQMTVRRFLNGDVNLASQVIPLVQNINITADKVGRYAQLHRKIYPVENIEYLRGMMTDAQLIGHLDRAISEFKVDNLKGARGIIKFDATTGKVNFDRRGFKKMINEFYFLALKDIHENHSKLFQEAQNPYQHGYYFAGLRGVINNLTQALKTAGYDYTDLGIDAYFDDILGHFQSCLLSYAEIFHNLPLYARDASTFEKWSSFLGQLFPTELAEIFDPEDPLMEMSRHEISMYLRKRVALNNNKIPPDLFSGDYKTGEVRYGNDDREKMMADLKKRAEAILERPVEGWELQRALTYGLGIGIANLMDPEVICTADPNVDAEFRDLYSLAPVLSAKHNWGLGRGYPASGLFPHLLAMDVTLYPEEKGFVRRLFDKGYWSPEEFDKYVKTAATEYGGELFDSLLSRQGKYQELLNMINIGTSLNSRHGWRLQDMRTKLGDFIQKGIYGTEKTVGFGDAHKLNGWGNKEWGAYFDLSMQLYGTASNWWWVAPRVERELKRLLATEIGYDEANTEFEKYSTGEKGLQKKYRINVNGEEREVNFGEYRVMRTNQLRGDAFFQYAQRNPGDFLLLLGQLAPELLDTATNYFDTRDNLKAACESAGKSELETKKELAKRQRLIDRWGESQFERLRQIRDWLNVTLIGSFKTAGLVGEGKKFKDEKAVIEYFLNKSGTAYEKCIKEKVTGDVVKEDQPARSRKWLVRSDVMAEDEAKEPEAELLRRALFDEGGFIGLVKQRENLGGFTEGTNYDFGEFEFFYKMGEIWTLKQGDINPFAADMNHFAVYKHMGKSGEEVVKRYLGDAQAVYKMITEVAKLDEMLLHMANERSGELKDLDKLFTDVFLTLKGIISKEAGQRGCYILAQIVGQFFQEHSITRMPILGTFPFDAIMGAALGDKLSLSKLITENRWAKSMDQNALRTFFRHLHDDLHVVELDGMWSVEQLNRAFHTETDTFVVGDAVPNIMTFIALYLLFIYLKKATAELSGSSKKG